jgi:hypothetical protein
MKLARLFVLTGALILCATAVLAFKFPYWVSIDGKGTPEVGKPVTIVIKYSAIFEIENVIMKLHLPAGIRLDKGEMSWEEPSLTKEKILIREIQVTPLSQGDFEINVEMNLTKPAKSHRGDPTLMRNIFITVDSQGGAFNYVEPEYRMSTDASPGIAVKDRIAPKKAESAYPAEEVKK